VVRILGFAALTLLIVAIAAQARPRTRREFVTTYPKTAGTRLDACATCHTPEGAGLNPYGAALKRATLNFQAIERLDSDGDGFTNRTEILALSLPGDPRDRPGAHRDSTGADSVRRDSIGARPDTTRRDPSRAKRHSPARRP
jgi:hypothetical protein